MSALRYAGRALCCILALMISWQKLGAARILVMALLGFAALCVAAFLLAVAAGWAAVGVSLLVLAYLTDGSARDESA